MCHIDMKREIKFRAWDTKAKYSEAAELYKKDRKKDSKGMYRKSYEKWAEETGNKIPWSDSILKPRWVYEWVMYSDGKIAWPEGGWDLYGPEDDQERYILTQYTGLKDKNGVEIYEGDIAVWDGEEWSKQVVEYGVHTGGTSSYIGFNISILGGSAPEKEMSSRIEVIGNIYQNPELLDNEK